MSDASNRRRGLKSRARSHHGVLRRVLLPTCVGLISLAGARAGASPAGVDGAKPTTWGSKEQVGLLEIDPAIRRRVRGDRPANASVHLAYAVQARRADRQLYARLQAFETRVLGDDGLVANAPKQTIRETPPDAWMERLRMPDFDIRWNAQLVEYLRWFKDDPDGQALLHAWLDRLGRYETQMRDALVEAGAPGDLVYVALIESGFDPRAQSGVGAGGMWQFMEPTARVYGLQGDYWRDERFDYLRSAYAAGAYLADLQTRFGTWELALAAYNAGYGLVVKTIRYNNTNNFWALSEIENGLPRQTINYVPKILATAIAAKNPEVFGYTRKPMAAAVLIDVVVPGGTRIEDLAKAIAVDEELLREYNGHWLRGRTRPDQKRTEVRIPKDALPRFEAAPAKLKSPDQPLATYEVRLGEHLDEIAAAHGLSPTELRRLNGVHDSGELAPGVILALPAAVADEDRPQVPKPIVAVPSLEKAGGGALVFFRVTRASTPRRISKAFGVEWEQIVAWNDLDRDARLVDGQMLQIFVPDNFDPASRKLRVYTRDEVTYVARGSQAHLDALLAQRELVRRGYKVKKGESLARIAKRYSLSTGSLARINGVMRGHRPEEGEVLVIYVPKGKTKGTVKAPAPQPTTIGFETLVLSGATDEGPSDASSTKLPGQTRPLQRPQDEVGDEVGDGEQAPTNEAPDASEGTQPERRAPSTATSAKLPGRRVP